MIKRNYLFLAVETGLTPDKILKQNEPSILRVCGVLGNSELTPIYDFDVKINLKNLDDYNNYIVEQYTTYKEGEFWSNTPYQSAIVIVANNIVEKCVKNDYELILGSHNHRNWTKPVLNNFLLCRYQESESLENIVRFGDLLHTSAYKYVCTMELGNTYNMLYNKNVKLSLDSIYKTFLGYRITAFDGAMKKAYQSLAVFKFFKDNTK